MSIALGRKTQFWKKLFVQDVLYNTLVMWHNSGDLFNLNLHLVKQWHFWWSIGPYASLSFGNIIWVRITLLLGKWIMFLHTRTLWYPRRHPRYAVTINNWVSLFEIIMLCSTCSNAATSLIADTYTFERRKLHSLSLPCIGQTPTLYKVTFVQLYYQTIMSIPNETIILHLVF